MHVAARSSLTSEINVTPLVDVCLVLLIIFMVVTPMIVTGLPVDLPGAKTGDALARQPLQITLTADGSVWLGDSVMRVEELGSALQRENTDRPVVLQADKSLLYGKVVEALDGCRAAGFRDVGLAAQPRE
jgi:biopolymer transport protein TolR